MSMIPMSPINIYEGASVRFYTSSTPQVNSPQGAFLDFKGNPFDPDIVEFSYVVDGVVTSYEYVNPSGDSTGTIVRDDVGQYHCVINTLNQVGR